MSEKEPITTTEGAIAEIQTLLSNLSNAVSACKIHTANEEWQREHKGWYRVSNVPKNHEVAESIHSFCDRQLLQAGEHVISGRNIGYYDREYLFNPTYFTFDV